MKRKLLIGLCILAVIGLGSYWFYSDGDEEETDEPESTLVSPERGNLRTTVASTGRVVSQRDVEIKCKASGEVTAIYFDVSDKVNTGDLLVELDPENEERNVRKAEVSLNSSQAQLSQARHELSIAEQQLVTARVKSGADLELATVESANEQAKTERQAHLLEQELISQEEFEAAQLAAIRARSSLDVARANDAEELATQEQSLELKRQSVRVASGRVETDQLSLADARQRLDETKIYAPIDGIITARYVQEGQIVSSATNNVGGGDAIMIVSDLSRIFILASIDESDIGNVEVDQRVMITADAFDERRFMGRVERIAAMGENVSNVIVFEVKIEVLSDNKELLRPEMTANVEIVTADKEDILTVPSSAVSRRRRGSVVTVMRAGVEEQVEVTVGVSDGERTEVIDGISEEDQVVIQGAGAASSWNRGGRGEGERDTGRDMRRTGRMMMH